MHLGSLNILIRSLVTLHIHEPVFDVHSIRSTESDNELLIYFIIAYESEDVKFCMLYFHYIFHSSAELAWTPTVPF